MSGFFQTTSVANYIEREVKRRSFVVERWNFREKEKRELESEAKKKAGGVNLLIIKLSCLLVLHKNVHSVVKMKADKWAGKRAMPFYCLKSFDSQIKKENSS